MTDVSASPDRTAVQFAAASRTAIAHHGRSIACSTDVGWTSLLLDVREQELVDVGDPLTFETLPTPDQTLAISIAGVCDLDCFSNGRWRRAVRQPGSGGLTPGGETDRLRLRPRGSPVIRAAHLFIPQAFFHEAREHFRHAGASHSSEPLTALAFRDPAITHVVHALVRAVETGGPNLYAETIAQYLATHLLSQQSTRFDESEERRIPGPLTDARLARVCEFMSAHFQAPLSLQRLATEACISKFHFVRLFKQATGQTPHEWLVTLRMRAARQMLRDTDLTLSEIAASSGYASAAHFSRAFGRNTGRTPTQFRSSAQRSAARTLPEPLRK